MSDRENMKLLLRVHLWRDDILQFVRDMFHVIPTRQQEDILRAISVPGSHVAVASGHGIGKTSTLAWTILNGLVCYDDIKIACVAPTAHQLDDILWPEVKLWADKMASPWKEHIEITGTKISMKDCSGFAVARTGRKENPEALAGFHSQTVMMFVIDEASGIPEEIFTTGEGSLSTKGARIIMTSNPTRTTGYFYDAFHKSRKRWTTLQFSSADSSLVDPGYVEDMREKYGEDSDIYKVRVLGQFPSGSALQFIPRDKVDEAAARVLKEEDFSFAPVILSLDVAAFGGDRAVLLKRQGVNTNVLWSGINVELTDLVALTAEWYLKEKPDALFVDKTGIGEGVCSQLRQFNIPVTGINFSQKALNKRYGNKRAEMYFLMKEWLTNEPAYLPDLPDFHEELCTPEFHYDTAGRLMLEKKEDIRKRLGRSPDYADALALTFAMPVQPRNAAVREMVAMHDTMRRKSSREIHTWRSSKGNKSARR